MIEQTLRRFCESQHRTLIVISLTLAMGCALLVPLVDIYLEGQSEKQRMQTELESAHQVARDIDEFEVRVAERIRELARLDAKTVTEETSPEFRKRLQSLARDTGCTMRKLHVGSVSARPWYDGDDPLAASPDQEIRNAQTPFTLERWPLSITLHGPMANLQKMLDQMWQDDMFVHTKNLELQADGQQGRAVMLQLELWYFALSRKT